MPRARLLLSAVAVLAVWGCGDDDGGDGGEGSGTEVTADDGEGGDTEVTADDLNGTTYEITEAEGIELPDESALRFSFEEGNLAVSGGCNNMMGGFEITDGQLVAGPLAGTQMACEQPLMDLDTAIAAFVESSPEVSLDGDTLVLTSGDTVLTFNAT